MLRLVAFVTTDVSEKRIASIIRMARISELVFLRSVIQLLVAANVPISLIIFTQMMEAVSSSETSVLTTDTRRYILKYSILHDM
jgi:hypothetical protein